MKNQETDALRLVPVEPTEARQAYAAVRRAIERGGLVRPETCERCGLVPSPTSVGRAAIQAHHHDYSKPLDVEWICAKCHRIETPLPLKPGAPNIGERNPISKLTDAQVRLIRVSSLSGPALAKRLGVDRSTINRVRRGEQWRHVQ